MNSEAAACLENLEKLKVLPENYYYFSIPEHLFFGNEYEKAFMPNLQLVVTFLNSFDYNNALNGIERLIICTTETENKEM